jgi:hypothetical protein
MKKPFLIILFLASWILFASLGIWFGIFYQQQKDLIGEKNIGNTLKSLSSKNIASIIAYGQLTRTEGRDITISYLGDSMKILIEDGCKIYLIGSRAGGQSEKKEINFEEIKVGDHLNITIKIMPDGQIIGQSILIL